ncbi:MAG: hypothetical protein ABIQ35_09170 [Verrucomicrobiota bacterium]
MVDYFLNLFDTSNMLTTTKNALKPTGTASPSVPRRSLSDDLKFASANQRLEGFPGIITETVAAHKPDLKEIARIAKQFGAQIPTEENRQRKPLFKR